MTQTALRIVSIARHLHTTGKKAGTTSTFATVGTPSPIPGLTKVVGKAWYAENESVPADLVVGAAVECGVETREGKDYLSILKIVPADELETANTGASLF